MVTRRSGDIDPRRILKTMNQLGSASVETGVFSTSRYADGTPVAYIYYIQEVGSEIAGIPPRPTFIPAIEEVREQAAEGVAVAVRNALRGGSLRDGLDMVGLLVKGSIQSKITELQSPILKPETVRARGRRHHAGMASEKPLVDSGLLLDSIQTVTKIGES